MATARWRKERPAAATPVPRRPDETAAIEEGVRRLFDLVTDRLVGATNAFLTGDRTYAAEVVAADPAVDALQLDVEDLAQEALVDRRALSDDEVRLLVAVLRVVPELERSADLVEHIALRTGALTACLPADAGAVIAEMGATAASMWRRAARAWVDRDATIADSLRADDDVLDDLHVRLTALLSSAALAPSEAIELGLVARFFERLGDHAVNVTKRLAFLTPEPVPA